MLQFSYSYSQYSFSRKLTICNCQGEILVNGNGPSNISHSQLQLIHSSIRFPCLVHHQLEVILVTALIDHDPFRIIEAFLRGAKVVAKVHRLLVLPQCQVSNFLFPSTVATISVSDSSIEDNRAVSHCLHSLSA